MAGDAYWAEGVKLLLPMTGAHNSVTFTDLALLPMSKSVIGNAKIVTSVADPFSAADGVGYFDGNGDYLNYSNHANFDLSSADFTLEGWFYKLSDTGNAKYGCIFSKRVHGGLWDWGVEGGTGSIGFRYGDSSNGSLRLHMGSGVALNTWYHFAVTRSGSTLRAFLNGVLIATATISGAILQSTSDVMVGRSLTAYSDNQFYGYLSQLRLTKGFSRYLANFAVPSGPFPDFGVQLSGTITESLAAEEFIVESYNVSDGVLSGRGVFTGPDFSLEIRSAEKFHYVTVRPDMGDTWKPNTLYALNEKVFPGDPVSIPYYFKRLSAGTSGTTEPAWSIVPGTPIDDGAVLGAWEVVERIVQPVTHGPLTES